LQESGVAGEVLGLVGWFFFFFFGVEMEQAAREHERDLLDFDNYYPALSQFTFPTEILPLSKLAAETINHLNEDLKYGSNKATEQGKTELTKVSNDPKLSLFSC
jgi:hypothetical protein